MGHGFNWYWLLTASYAAWFLMEGWVVYRDRRPASGQAGDRGSVRLIIAMIVVTVTLAWFAAIRLHVLRFGGLRLPLLFTGIALMWIGMAFRLWAIRTLGKFFRATVFVQDEHRLVTAGPYRLLRHPAYTGTLLTMLGLGLALGNGLSLAVLLAGFAIAYAYRIRVEENALKLRFGAAYGDYARGRWLLIPFVC